MSQIQVQEIGVCEVYKMIEDGASIELIDVRNPDEYQDVHALSAKLFPLPEVNLDAIENLKLDKEQPIYLICRSGARSMVAAKQFVEAGFTNVFNVAGGTIDWVECGLPIAK